MAGAGSSFHLFGKVLQYGARHRAAILLLRRVLLALNGKYRPDLVEIVVVFVAGVETLLVRHAGEQQDTHRQA